MSILGYLRILSVKMLSIGVIGDGSGVNFRFVWFVIICWITSINKLATSNIDDPRGGQEEWVVRIEGGAQVASLLALQSGYKHLGPVSRINRIDFNEERSRDSGFSRVVFSQKFVKKEKKNFTNESNNKEDIRWEIAREIAIFSRSPV